MQQAIGPAAQRDMQDAACTYPIEGEGICGAPRRPGSSYCTTHHALCYLPRGSAAERRRLRRIEALAEAVGGRRSRDRAAPSPRFLERLERSVRGLAAI